MSLPQSFPLCPPPPLSPAHLAGVAGLQHGFRPPHLFQLDLSCNELLGLVSQRLPSWEVWESTDVFHVPAGNERAGCGGRKKKSMVKRWGPCASTSGWHLSALQLAEAWSSMRCPSPISVLFSISAGLHDYGSGGFVSPSAQPMAIYRAFVLLSLSFQNKREGSVVWQ